MNKDINVTPTLEPTTNLGPFKFFALTNFPYIEQTFDTLTNYELMCKIAEALNKFIQNNNATNENVINLYNAFVSLQKYVNDYFDDLNVQNEVNNKLDQMASDGTLNRIINQEIFGQLNTDLTNLKNKVGNEALPSPESSVSQNINLLNNKIGDETLPNPDSSISQNITNNTNKINTLQNEVATLQTNIVNRNYYKNGLLVVFGDSYSQPEIQNSANARWVTRVCEALQMNPKNFAIAGAGFARTNNLIYTQIQNADSQMSDDEKNNTKCVIIYAGYNDIVNNLSSDDIQANIGSCVNTVLTLFPNATVLLAPFNWGYNGLKETYNIQIEVLINRIRRVLSNKPVIIANLCRYYTLGISSYNQNNAHPSANGYDFIASQFVNLLLGGSEYVSFGQEVNLLHGNRKYCYAMVENGNVHIIYYSDFQNQLTSYNEVIAKLPAFATPYSPMIYPVYTAQGEYVGFLLVNNNGDLSLRITNTLQANRYIFTQCVSFKASNPLSLA